MSLVGPWPARQHKYRAKRTNGYASKREAHYAELLAMRQRAGDILGWLEQVPVKLPGGIRYVIDFQVHHKDGTISWVEVKGFETAAWKMKMKLLEESHPWIFERLQVVK